MLKTTLLSNFSVILVRPQYVENVGFTARSMKVFGCENLLLVNPQFDSLDPACQTASASADIVERARIHDSLQNAIKDVHRVVGFSRREHRIERPNFLLDDWVTQLDYSNEKNALVFGPENFGLSNEDKSFCEIIVTIPSEEQRISLNLSHAVSVVLYCLHQKISKTEFHRQDKTPASQDNIQRLIDLFINELEHAGHFNPQTRIYQIERIKNLIMRLQLSDEEYSAMMGIVKSLGINKQK